MEVDGHLHVYSVAMLDWLTLRRCLNRRCFATLRHFSEQ